MLILALAITQPVEAQSFKPDFFKGWDAYVKGDFATALKHFRPLAKQGQISAQNFLGLMYRDGNGVLQDLVMGYVWNNVAATSFAPEHKDLASKPRDEIYARLTATERRLAVRLSKLCLKKPAKCPEYSDD